MTSTPPIRYPLPTLVLLAIVGLAAWIGAPMVRALRTAMAARWQRAFAGPSYPRSSVPQVVAGAIVRKGLLLHDDIAVSERPGAGQSDTIRHRMFVDVYDTWPVRERPHFVRVGNRRPIGWVSASEVLLWDTRLVVRPPRATSVSARAASLPVLAWNRDSVAVAVWDEQRPWQAVDGRRWIRLADLPPESWGVWISRDELLELLRRSLELRGSQTALDLRLRAILGRSADERPLDPAQFESTKDALPRPVFSTENRATGEASERLAAANNAWEAETSWSGLSFKFLPLTDLP